MLQTSSSYHKCHYHLYSTVVQTSSVRSAYRVSCYPSNYSSSGRWVYDLLGSRKSCRSQFRCVSWKYGDVEETSDEGKSELDTGQPDLSLQVHTLTNFPLVKLYGEVVMVRFDASLMLKSKDSVNASLNRALSTIGYLYNAGARLVLVSNWAVECDGILLSEELVAERLSSHLQVRVMPGKNITNIVELKTKWAKNNGYIVLLDNLRRFKEEVANCSLFAEKLSSGVSIFVNDTFCLSHKILASTVGISRFCHASIAGFHFEEELRQLMRIQETATKPYIAIVGGSNFVKKAKALHFLASKCSGLIFHGRLAFQIMNGLGYNVPTYLLEHDAVAEVSKLIQLAEHRKISIYFPKDYWCTKVSRPELVELFPSDRILTGWQPAELGPVTIKEIASILRTCKKIMLIGSTKQVSSEDDRKEASQLASVVENISHDCEVILVGSGAGKIVSESSDSSSQYTRFNNASAVWEFLKGRTLPGVAALDRAYPETLDWKAIYTDPTKPLKVDIGSGNGLFIFNMARSCRSSNYLGLEINKKLVRRCLDDLLRTKIKNRYFIATNATSTFHSIVSTYPGDLLLVAIQCPNPDFNRETHRWRMVQRALVEAIVDLLACNGKVFLQSDIKAVATRIKEQFIMYGKGKLVVDGDMEWLPENPFGVRTDWEQHVIERGDRMFRTMLRKT